MIDFEYCTGDTSFVWGFDEPFMAFIRRFRQTGCGLMRDFAASSLGVMSSWQDSRWTQKWHVTSPIPDVPCDTWTLRDCLRAQMGNDRQHKRYWYKMTSAMLWTNSLRCGAFDTDFKDSIIVIVVCLLVKRIENEFKKRLFATGWKIWSTPMGILFTSGSSMCHSSSVSSIWLRCNGKRPPGITHCWQDSRSTHQNRHFVRMRLSRCPRRWRLRLKNDWWRVTNATWRGRESNPSWTVKSHRTISSYLENSSGTLLHEPFIKPMRCDKNTDKNFIL